MIFHPQNLIKVDDRFVFWGDIYAIAHPCLNKDLIKNFWHSFTFNSSTLNISESKEFILRLETQNRFHLIIAITAST